MTTTMKKLPALLMLFTATGAYAADPIPASVRATHTLSFPAGVELVNVNVSVLNVRERFVTDLGRDDFLLLEDGVPQELTMFAQEELPLSLVMLLDMSASMNANVRAVRQAAGRLIQKLRPQDEAQIIEFNTSQRVLQDFTSDQGALLKAIQQTRPNGSTALHNVLYITLKDLARQSKAQDLRRRAIVLLSDGQDTASMVTDDQVMELARSAEINIYSILIAAGDDAEENELERARYLLTSLARESGGQSFFPRDAAELMSVYDRIAQELQSQYSIGYIPKNPSLDGGWRQILVMLQKHGLRVRHRLGYYAVPDGPSRAKTGDAGRAGAFAFNARP